LGRYLRIDLNGKMADVLEYGRYGDKIHRFFSRYIRVLSHRWAIAVIALNSENRPRIVLFVTLFGTFRLMSLNLVISSMKLDLFVVLATFHGFSSNKPCFLWNGWFLLATTTFALDFGWFCWSSLLFNPSVQTSCIPFLLL